MKQQELAAKIDVILASPELNENEPDIKMMRAVLEVVREVALDMKRTAEGIEALVASLRH